MSKRFRVEHKDYEKPPIIVTIHQPPFTKDRILHKTGWNPDSVTITDITVKFEVEE